MVCKVVTQAFEALEVLAAVLMGGERREEWEGRGRRKERRGRSEEEEREKRKKERRGVEEEEEGKRESKRDREQGKEKRRGRM